MAGQNSDVLYPKIDADQEAGSGSNNRINYRYLQRCSYIVLVSISRWHGVVLLCAHMNINVLKDITWNLFIIITIKVT